MKFYMCSQGKVMGPYLPEEITSLFGGVSPDALISTAFDYESGRTRWRKISLFPELAGCIKREIDEPLVKYSTGAPAGLALNILSTDDDSNIRTLLWHMLTDAGHTVDFARDGEEVFARLAAKKYDLVVLDVNMPKMNGYKVSELLHDKLPKPPKVIIFTGRDLEKERMQFVCSGADAILNKGTGNDKLIRTIEGLFFVKPEKPAPAENVFTPEPTPPVLEGVFAAPAPATPAQQPVPPTSPPLTVPQYVPLIAAVAPAVTGRKTYEQALPGAQSPAAGRENSGKLDIVLEQWLLENKTLKTDLMDIRRLLGHVELEYTQLEKQFEKQALKFLNENKEVAKKLESYCKNIRNYVTLATLLLLVAVLAAVVLF